MLILGRKVGEKLIFQIPKEFEGDITAEVLSIQNQKADVGITAPREVKIWREELLDGNK